ncbi:hypothetical protein [Pseudolactococcus carnosus]|uniref:hypothetical protein n=1 Tax=Pseudolactococcus carnosus TaxID=2749961 RepID=UPI000812BE1F|nr:hypothetical protein [Lactococcus carnosus]SCA92734.1 hypothetical protein LP2241_50309 [Lactococcus piscium]MCJ1969634.1 hypothetical protein [Lactococcus carnosus]MCJ1973831.1 hypothetical protein [Lactococcus carnosus]MCJ1974832.1 hypothetical protein [Lactococcus carnosus]MCJ1980530.1 hypothetical protein [Lactococcus carnosus]
MGKSKSPQKIDKVQSSKKKDPVKIPDSSAPKKVELVGKTFEIDGDKYHMKMILIFLTYIEKETYKNMA